MSDPSEDQDHELELELETVKDLDVDPAAAQDLAGGNSAGATRPGPTHAIDL